MDKIKKIEAIEVIDSRGNPTVKVFLETNKGVFSAESPSGASTGKNEAVELRDGGERYFGKGVRKAVSNINNIIAPKLKGFKVNNQWKIDKAMIEIDGTENKSKLGANAILPVSIAASRAGARAEKIPLFLYLNKLLAEKLEQGKALMSFPFPSFNIINGGVHAGDGLSIQEFMVIPTLPDIGERIRAAAEIYHNLKIILGEKFSKEATNVGDEGGFAPPIKKAETAISLVEKAAEKSGYEGKITVAIDAAASQFYNGGDEYNFEGEKIKAGELVDYYFDLVKKHNFAFLEDPFAEDDWVSWQWLERKIMKNGEGKKRESFVPLIGDDLLTTNPKRMEIAKEKKACNGMIIKPNQIGTITETLEAVSLAKKYGWTIVVSHRSGDTCDSFIADLAVAAGANYMKSGAPARGERTAKYNRLIEISKELDYNNRN